MKTIAKCLVFTLGLTSIGCGIYFGLWVCLLGGFAELINACKLPVTTAADICWAIFKIAVTGIVTACGLFGGVLLCGYSLFGIKTKSVNFHIRNQKLQMPKFHKKYQ